MSESSTEVCFTQLWVIVISEHKMSQGSVVTRLTCGGIFTYYFSRNLLLSVNVKKF